MRHIVLIICTFWLYCPIFAQSINGLIIDENKAPLAAIEIYESNLGLSTHSDKHGFFRLKIPANQDSITLLFLSDQYELKTERVLLPIADTLRITLRKLTIELDEITIKDHQQKLFGIRQMRDIEGLNVYAGKKSEVVILSNSLANLATGNPRQVYNQIVGLNIQETNDGGLQLNIGGRGLDPNRTAHFNTRQNGYDISADVLGYPESYYTPPAEALEEIQIIRGAASLQYGTQFGGLVNFKLKQPSPYKSINLESRQTVGSFGLVSTYNRLHGKTGKLSYNTFYNYKSGNGFRPNSDFTSHLFYGQVKYQYSEKLALSAEITHMDYLAQQAGGLTDVQFYENPLFSNRTRNFFSVDWTLYAIKAQYNLTNSDRFSIQWAGLNAERNALGFRTNRVSQPDILGTSRDLIKGTFDNFSVEGKYLKSFNWNNNLSHWLIGAKIYKAKNKAIQGPGDNGEEAIFTLAEDPVYPFSSSFTFPNNNIALFSEFVVRLSDKLSITPGLRYEYINTEADGTYQRRDFDLAGNVINSGEFQDFQSLGRSLFLTGLGIAYDLNQNIEWYGNISQNYRSVTFSDLRIINPTFQVDPNIKDERGFTADIGMRGTYQNNFSYDLGSYILYYNDRIGEILTAESRVNGEGVRQPTGRIIRLRSNIGNAIMFGTEGRAEWTFMDRLKEEAYPFKSSLFANIAYTRSSYLSSEKPGIEGNQVEFIPALNVKTGFNFNYRRFITNVQLTFLSQQFTDATNALQDRNDNQRGIEGSIPSYQIIDWAFALPYKKFRIEGGVNNLLDTAYFTRRATGYPGPGIIPSETRSYYLTLAFQL